jgi:hypothetical protein
MGKKPRVTPRGFLRVSRNSLLRMRGEEIQDELREGERCGRLVPSCIFGQAARPGKFNAEDGV